MYSKQKDSRNFQIGHVTVTMRSQNPVLLDLAGSWMRTFEIGSAIQAGITIRFTMMGYESNERVPFTLPAEAKLSYKNEDTKYYEYRDLWIVILQCALIIVNRTQNKILAFTHYNDLKKPEHLEDFMHPLLELLRQHGVYAHHAAAVSYKGCGLFIPGKSGQGKTTLSADLLNHDFDFLADDRCFLRDHEQGLEVLGFYEPIRYFPENLDHIQALQACNTDPNRHKLDNGKNVLDLYPLYKNRIIDRCQLVGLLFPYYSPQEQTSRIESMTPANALIAILPLTLVCFNRTTSKSHFEFSVKLTTVLPAVKLIMGQDRECWHELVKKYLSSILKDKTTP